MFGDFKVDSYNVDRKYGITASVRLKASEPQSATNYGIFFTAPHAMTIYRVLARWEVASTSGTLQVLQVPDGTAVSSGTDIMSSTIDTSGTAATNVLRRKFDLAVTRLNQGDSLAIESGGTLTNLEDLVVTVYMTPAARGDHIT